MSDEAMMAAEHKMWAVVDIEAYSESIRAIELTKQAAKNTALASWEPNVKWAYAKEYLGWRVVPVTVIVPDEGER